MSRGDLVGFLACGLVLATFCMRRMAALRLTAIGSNLTFIAYAAGHGLLPILLLHLVLLPLNLWRLLELHRGAGRAKRASAASWPVPRRPAPWPWHPGRLAQRMALGLVLSAMPLARLGAGPSPPADFWFEPVWLAGPGGAAAILNRAADWSDGDAAVVLLWPWQDAAPGTRDGLTRALVAAGAAVLELDYRPDEMAQIPALLARALQILRQDFGAGLLLVIGQGQAGPIALARAEADSRGPPWAAGPAVVAAAALAAEGARFAPGAQPAMAEAWPLRAALFCAALPPSLAAREACRSELEVP